MGTRQHERDGVSGLDGEIRAQANDAIDLYGLGVLCHVISAHNLIDYCIHD